MVKHVDPDQILVKMPSLRAIKSFVAAAKYQNFTRAAEALCVTQAAVSRQIRELEASLDVKLFRRAGRAVELTPAGSIFFDACYLSFVNIAQAAQRIQYDHSARQELCICCTPAFATFWLSDRLPDFIATHPNIDINLVTTNNFLHMEPGVKPDVYINKSSDPREGYHGIALFYDLIYPVCTPQYLADHPQLTNLESLQQATLLNLSPYGRSQVSEHIDWGVWFSLQNKELPPADPLNHNMPNSNDYNMLIKMTLNHQGVCLGWQHLVGSLLAEGKLVRIGQFEACLQEKRHYLSYAADKEANSALKDFKLWMLAQVQDEPTSVVPNNQTTD
ncbi:MAG: LysR family transcriptional regulator [Gammaproteobacteria bacterium]|nr:LysR family transcriptional regulator [Gammaproteobacteria bacterium]